MSGAEAARLEELARRLSGILPGAPRVEVTGAASLGAQRSTLFVDCVRNGERRAAVAQIASSVLANLSIETEAALLDAAARAGVPVPELLAWDAELGAIVTSRVGGESIPRRVLRMVESRPELGAKLAADCGRALAAIHAMPDEKLDGLPDLADPLRYTQELAAGLSALDTPVPALRLGLSWLRRHPPESPTRACVVHGDFRNGNLLVTERGLAAVLDWELAHRGDAMEDLAWLCLRTWRFGADEREAGGFAPLPLLRDAYESAGGSWREDAFRWWTVARTVWWGLGLARQAQAFLDGQARSIVLAASGRRVVELEYDLLTLIESGSGGAS